MLEELTPYIPHSAGDLITAEDWNEMQVLVKQDIATQVGAVQQDLDEFKEAPVDADTFGGKTPGEWVQSLDDRYVQKADLESGWGEYRRYFKQIDRSDLLVDGYRPVIIKHNLHRYPLVNLFELGELDPTNSRPNDDRQSVLDSRGNRVKFLVYYANRQDPVSDLLRVEGEDTVYIGDPLPLLMEQFHMTVKPDQLLVDVLNDLWDKMFDPGLSQDNFRPGSYGHSQYLQDDWLRETVASLDRGGIWDNLQMAIRPQMMSAFFDEYGGGDSRIQVFHISQDVLELRYNPQNFDGQREQGIDLMVLLRT